MRKYGLESWLSCIDVDNHRHSEIDQSIHAALYEAVNTWTIQKIIDGKKSLSGVATWKIITGWFDDNGSTGVATARAMNELDSLLLSRESTAESYISSFADIMDRLDVANSSLPEDHQIRWFLKGVVDPHFLNVVSNIHEDIRKNIPVTIQDCYSRVRTEEN